MSEWVEYHLPCPKCTSSNGFSVNDRGWGHCFVCGVNVKEGEEYETSSFTIRKKKGMAEFITDGYVRDLPSRGISEEICKKFNYQVGTNHKQQCHIANFYDTNRKLVGQKIRYPDKSFQIIGNIDTLFGKHLWVSGRTIVVTEGELDALAVSEANGGKYPVVSIPHGAQSAKKILLKEREWLEKNFEKIILMFDEDEHGRAAVDQCAPIFTPGKCFIASLSEKDACECLDKGKIGELVTAVFNAKEWRLDGIALIDDLKEVKIEWGISSPFPSLTEWTYGFRPQELYTLGAGTGIGKTEFFKELIVHLRIEHDEKVGILFLEEAAPHTVATLTGKIMGKPIHIPGTEYDPELKKVAIDKLKGPNGDSVVFYNHFGHTDFETIKNTIRHMVVSMECKWIFLDHITAIVQGEPNIDLKLGKYIKELASLIRELDVSLFMISHLNTPDGDQSHEEGARVTLKNLYGSRAIGQWSNFVFALERNQQNPEESNISTLRVLKDRYTGSSTGKTCKLKFNLDSNILGEVDWVI